MEGFLRVPLPKHRVAIAGKVVDAQTQRPIAGAVATIESGPEAFERLLAIREAQSGASRPDRVVTADDGCFGFIDLPDGVYTLAIEAPKALYHGVVKRDFTVSQAAGGASIVPIALPPTGVRGVVRSQDTQEPLSLARVRVEGGEESAHCDANGNFSILGVQPGKRRLSIGASGHRRAAVAAQVTLATVVDVGTILLEPSGA